MSSPQQSPLSKVRRIHDAQDGPARPPPPAQYNSNNQQQQKKTEIKIQRSNNSSKKSEEQFDADLLIEQLMREAEADPGLREMSGLNNVNKNVDKRNQDLLIREKVEQQHKKQEQMKWIQQQQQQQQQQRSNSYQQQQRSSSSSSGSYQKKNLKDQLQQLPPMPQLPPLQPPRPKHDYDGRPPLQQQQQQQQQQQIHNRSRSADTRRRPSVEEYKPPTEARLANFKRSMSNENFTEEIMHGVVTDQQHHSVKDLVRMIEKNTKSESANPYVRKWGCDLISPEPHTKNVTYRREKKELIKRQQQQQQQREEEERRNEAYANNNNNNSNNKLENNFRMSSHVAEMDHLLGRQQSLMEDSAHCSRPHEVTWPPPQSSPTPLNDHPSRSPVIRKDEFDAAYGHEEEFKSNNLPQVLPQVLPPVSNRKPPTPSSKKTVNDFEDMASDLDRSISNFQSGFASQLDSILKEGNTSSNKSSYSQQQQKSSFSSSKKS